LWSTAVVLLANRELLERAGVTPPDAATPWTWEEFTANLARLKATRTRDGQAVIPFTAAARPPMIEWAPLLVAHCGPLFPEAAERAGAGVRLAPKLPEALERVRALRAAGLMSPAFGVEDQPAVQALFTQGRLALLMTSPGFLKTVAAGKIPACVLPVPQGAYGRPITTGGLGCVAVVASGDAAREAAGQALARWLTSAEIAEAVPGWYLAPPARRSVKAFYARPLYAPLEAILPTARYIAPTVSVAFFEETILPNLQAVLLGQAPAASALEKIDKAWRRTQLD
jgi:multiple sugar transport system substrate-binding protein